MKVLGINGSPRANGNTRWALDTMGEVFSHHGIAFSVLHIGCKMAPCSGCFRCAKVQNRTCTLPDDGVNEAYEKMTQADGIVFGSPVYFGSMTSGMRCFLDRVGCIDMFNGRNLRFKVGAPVAIARRAGAVNAVDDLIHYINYAQMLLPGSLYWPICFGRTPGEIVQDQEGIQTLRVLAENMAYVMEAMAAGREKVPLPPQETKVMTNYIR